MNRVDILRDYINNVLNSITDDEFKAMGYIHLYGVAQASVLLAKKRKLNEELCEMGALLHDIYTYQNNTSKDHAVKGAIVAREILEELEIASYEEIDIICTAIYNHSSKVMIHDSYSELLKDADVLQHNLYHPDVPNHEKKRYEDLLKELDLFV